MKVTYVLIFMPSYEIIGVYSSTALAEEVAKIHMKKYGCLMWDYIIESHRLYKEI
ncbi:hypothetical protein I6I37_05080 [Listeria monocytogenes]|uniref:hypothetical protein n=1 Tax=Listeria TaxID=1637 RepID=UPI00191DCC4A|nr:MULTISPECIES: hypothetical protein [Listeria]EIE7986381.1 hypothetical protein [Listeria monocytogenes]EIT8143702.1 hypothetical protein [Listeria monocytogenes]QQU60426.1 hypothetical protein I6I37_05080 [Listeria monocytogenes]